MGSFIFHTAVIFLCASVVVTLCVIAYVLGSDE